MLTIGNKHPEKRPTNLAAILAAAPIVFAGACLLPNTAAAQAQAVYSPSPTACVGGYRTIHVVRGQGREGPGILIRCR